MLQSHYWKRLITMDRDLISPLPDRTSFGLRTLPACLGTNGRPELPGRFSSDVHARKAHVETLSNKEEDRRIPESLRDLGYHE
jgi:hypothetical protein